MRRALWSRGALLSSLAILWLNFLLTSRWSHIPGSINGPKRPWFVAALTVATILATWRWPRERSEERPHEEVQFGAIVPLAAMAGMVMLGVAVFFAFPPSTWQTIPFLDNFPGRFQSTVDGVALLSRGAFVGWQWHYLGGYHLSSDVTQSHAVLGAIPMWVFGPTIGFHLLHVLLFAAIPALVYWDLRDTEPRATAPIAAGITCVAVAGFTYLLLRSGDTNSLAGLFCLTSMLASSHEAARGNTRGSRIGGAGMVLSLALLNYVHAGFFIYAVLFLGLEAVFYRDRARAYRAVAATIAAFIAGLPLHWESWRYPAYFIANNVLLDTSAPFAVGAFLRKVYYNVELLWLPGRWFNDFTGLATACLPLILVVVWRVRSRPGFYAWMALVTILILRLNTPEFAYLFLRPVHVLAICVGPVIAVFLTHFVTSRALIASFLVVIGLYLQVYYFHVPHIARPRDADPALVDFIATLDGALILIENTPHRDMDADSTRATEDPPVPAHVEQLLATATGKRFYGGFWDGWQWSPARVQVLAGGAFKGGAIADVPVDRFTTELRKWGVKHLVVWSRASLEYLRRFTAADFAEGRQIGPWHHFELRAPDTRSVTTEAGRGALVSFDPLAARVRLDDMARDTLVTVRTNFHPSWSAATHEGAPVPLFAHDGQLAFRAPKDGAYDVELTYPRRPWLDVAAIVAILAGVIAVAMLTTLTTRPADDAARSERHR